MNAVESIPASWYVESGMLDRERAHVLSRGWRYAGDAAAVSTPGSYAAVDAAGLPVVLTRDASGRLHALANVCPHRGSIVAAGCGRRNTLQCGYHGWTFRLDGALHRAPGFDEQPATGLRRLRVAAIGSLVFVTCDPDAGPLEGELGPFLEAVGADTGLDLDRVELRTRVEHRIGANWKAVVENFIECYHCPLVHPTTLPGYGGDDYVLEDLGRLQIQRLARERFAFAYLFPLTQISAYGHAGAVVARSLSPHGPGETGIRLDYWFEPEVGAGDAERFVDWFETVVGEDVPLCESVQTGLGSGLLGAGWLDPVSECGPAAFHRLLREALGDG